MLFQLRYARQTESVCRPSGTRFDIKQVENSLFYIVTDGSQLSANDFGSIGFFETREDNNRIPRGQRKLPGQDLPTKSIFHTYTLTSLMRSFKLVAHSQDVRTSKLQEMLRVIRRHHLAAIHWSSLGAPSHAEIQLVTQVTAPLGSARTIRRTESAQRIVDDFRVRGRLNPPATAALNLWVLQALSDQSDRDKWSSLANVKRSVAAFIIEGAVMQEIELILEISGQPFTEATWPLCRAAMGRSKIAPFHYAANYVSNCSEPLDRDLHRRVQQAYAFELLLSEVSNVLADLRHQRLLNKAAVLENLRSGILGILGLDKPQAAIAQALLAVLDDLLRLFEDKSTLPAKIAYATRHAERIIRSRITVGTGKNFSFLPDARAWLSKSHGHILETAHPPTIAS